MNRRAWAGWRQIVVALLLAGVVSRAAVAPSDAAGASEPEAQVARLFQEIARLRGVPAPGPPPRVVVRTRQERERFIAGELVRKFPPARLEAERRALVAWGIIPPDFELRRFLTDLLLEQAAAYYDPNSKTMVLANWLDPDGQREALTHELVHALQDRQIDLDRFLAAPPGKGDEALARQSLIEGEAVAFSLERTLDGDGKDLAALSSIAPLRRAIEASATGPFLRRAPPYLRRLLTFPYSHGLGFVHAFRRRFSWTDVSPLYQDPPRATAQILHPERYFDRREDPAPVTLPDLTAVLGSDARPVFEDDAGEFGLGAILRQFLGETARVGHWRGDRYVLWETAPAQTVLVAVTVWASVADAAAFAAAYERLLRRKHGLGGAPGRGRFPRWEAGGRAFLVEPRGREVLLLEGAPAGLADPIRRAVWASRPAAARSPRRAPPRGRPGRISGRRRGSEVRPLPA